MAITREADFLRALYKSWSERMAANPAMTITELRGLFDEWHQATSEPECVTYKSGILAGVEALWALPVNADTSKVILYTHGGGFVVGSVSTHRKFAGHLAKRLGVTAVVFDYRRAPEYPFPAQLEDSTAAYCELLARGFKTRNVTIAGDSAGGNLAISTVLKLRDDGMALPGAVIAFSPWLDMELIGRTLETNAATDALVNLSVVQSMSAMFLGDNGSRTNPLANPLKANYKAGFPPLYIAAGGAETLLDNATGLAEIAKSAGVRVTLSVVEDMQHAFTLLAGRAVEADDELDRIADWFKAKK
jgi:epsilon-lactone hydrolase